MSSGESMSVDIPDLTGLETGTQYEYQWNEKQKQVLEEHADYHDQTIRFIAKVAKEGPEGNVLPPKPKEDLNSVLGIVSKSKVLNGLDLHEYLKEKIVSCDPATCPRISDLHLIPTSLEGILTYLRNIYHGIKTNNSVCLAASLDYGVWLETAFLIYHDEKRSGKVVGTWKLEGMA